MEALAIYSSNQEFFQPLLSAQLAGSLTALMPLCLSGCPVACLAHVSSCISLMELSLGCQDGSEDELGPKERAAVEQLTGLTDLHLL
jgi:hypothetical protein